MEIFNLLNKGLPKELGFTEASGATFGWPSTWVEGRTFNVGARVMF